MVIPRAFRGRCLNVVFAVSGVSVTRASVEASKIARGHYAKTQIVAIKAGNRSAQGA